MLIAYLIQKKLKGKSTEQMTFLPRCLAVTDAAKFLQLLWNHFSAFVFWRRLQSIKSMKSRGMVLWGIT